MGIAHLKWVSPKNIRWVAHVGKLVKPDSHVVVGTFCKRDFWHLSRLKTATTNAFHQIANMSQEGNDQGNRT